MQSESEEGGSDIDLLYEAPTTEKNGVKVVVPVKYNDRYEFVHKIAEQLAYFEGVYFDIDIIDNSYRAINPKNDFSIFRAEHFQWSSLCVNLNMHICLDNVYYPLDFSKLGISSISFPIGLRFSLSDGIFPTPNRESIRYTEEAKKTIAKKIADVADYFVEKYNDTITETEDIKSIFAYYNNSSRYINGYNQDKLDVSYLAKYASIDLKKPILKNVNKLNLERVYSVRNYFFNEYEVKYIYNNRRFKANKRNWKLDSRSADNTIYSFGMELDRKKQNYLRDLITVKSSVYFVRKERKIKLGSLTNSALGGYDNWISILKLKNHPKSQWREMIKEAQYIQELMTKDFINVDEVEIPKEWYEKEKIARSYNKKERVKLQDGEFKAKLARALDRASKGKNCKFEVVSFKYQDLPKQQHLTVYTVDTPENQETINKWWGVLHGVKFVIFSEREYKKFNVNIHNWITLETFLKGESKPLKRAVTALLIEQLKSKHSKAFDTKFLKYIKEGLWINIDTLHDYYVKNNRNSSEELLTPYMDKMDESISNCYFYVKKELEKMTFINKLLERVYHYDVANEAILEIARDLFKYRKIRIDWKYYKLQGEIIHKINKEEEED